MSRQYKNLNNPVPLRLDEETDIMITALAEKRKESKQEVMRSILRRGAQAELIEEFAADEMLHLVRKAIVETTKPIEERLAKINAKSAISSATAMYMNLETLGSIGKLSVQDLTELYKRAREKAVGFVKTPTNDDQI